MAHHPTQDRNADLHARGLGRVVPDGSSPNDGGHLGGIANGILGVEGGDGIPVAGVVGGFPIGIELEECVGDLCVKRGRDGKEKADNRGLR
jgi:hypothetical protein